MPASSRRVDVQLRSQVGPHLHTGEYVYVGLGMNGPVRVYDQVVELTGNSGLKQINQDVAKGERAASSSAAALFHVAEVHPAKWAQLFCGEAPQLVTVDFVVRLAEQTAIVRAEEL